MLILEECTYLQDFPNMFIHFLFYYNGAFAFYITALVFVVNKYGQFKNQTKNKDLGNGSWKYIKQMGMMKSFIGT